MKILGKTWKFGLKIENFGWKLELLGKNIHIWGGGCQQNHRKIQNWKNYGGWVHFRLYWENSAYLPWIFPDHPCMINENEGIWLLYQPWITDICFLYVQFEGKCIVSTCVWKDQKRKVTTKVFKHIFWSYNLLFLLKRNMKKK